MLFTNARKLEFQPAPISMEENLVKDDCVGNVEMEVHNALFVGFLDPVCENTQSLELSAAGIPFQTEEV